MDRHGGMPQHVDPSRHGVAWGQVLCTGPCSIHPENRSRSRGTTAGPPPSAVVGSKTGCTLVDLSVALCPRRSMSIRDEYIAVIGRLSRRFGRTYGHYRVPEHASLRQCLGYASRYVSGHSTEHYRYDRYKRALRSALRLNGDLCRTGTTVHVDIGCGPGLFSWVVHDHFDDTELNIQLYGYDHATEMIRLARLIQDRFESSIDVQYYDGLEQLLGNIATTAPPSADIIVTFGHVLAQLADDHRAIGVFATILERLTHTGPCLVLAVDAHGYATTFRGSFNRLCDMLEERNCTWGNRRDLGSGAFGILQGE